MERILFVTNGHLLNTNAIDFACYLAKATQSGLSGLFLEPDDPDPVAPRNLKSSYFLETAPETLAEVIHDTDQTMRYFENECRIKGVRCSLYRLSTDPVREVIQESRFADMAILGPEMLAGMNGEQAAVSFAKLLLLEAECPVIFAPAVFTSIDEIVFCYDGTASSVFAMKQFSYLFPNYHGKKVVVLQINDDKTIAHQEKIGKWLRNFYSQIGFQTLEGVVKDELFRYFFLKKKTFIVMGAYGRSRLSEFLHHSASDAIMKTTDLPLFIAHR